MSLKLKTAVVTGGVSGIGLATARNFLKEGVAVSQTKDNPSFDVAIL